MIRRALPRTALALALGASLAPAAASAQDVPRPAERWAAVEYRHVRFVEALDPWHLTSAEVGYRAAAGAAVLRANLARRFGQTGEQLELEAYPTLGRATYGYLAVGWSPSGLFPRMRYGAELFTAPGGGVELSAGARHLDFRADPVTLYTGSVGLYRGSWYLAARPFLAPRDGELLASGNLLVRRYLGEDGDHVGVRIGAGEAPPETASEVEFERLSAWQAVVEGRRGIGGGLGLRWSAGYEREELPGDETRRRWSGGVGVEARW